jgi:hypothetical protein
MSNTVSSYIPTAGAVFARGREQLTFPFTARPQAMTFYAHFIEAGSGVTSGSERILQIGDTSNGNPRLFISNAASNRYRLRWINAAGTGVGTAPVVSPSIGDVVELLCILNANGSVDNTTIINNTATAAGTSSPLVLPDAWSDILLSINSVGTIAVGFNKFLNILILRGVQTLATMRRIARSI